MSERMTSITVPGATATTGIMEYGRREPQDMIQLIRSYADWLRKQADEIDSCPDGDFRVETFIGPHVKRKRQVLQAGATKQLTR